MNSHFGKEEIYNLLFGLLENDLTDSERDRLLEWSRHEPDSVSIYHDFLRTYSLISHEVLSRVELGYGTSCDTEFDQALWNALSNCEKTAPEVEILDEEQMPPQTLTRRVVYPPREKRQISKFSIFMLLNAAAILFFILFLKFAPYEQGIEVATLTDSMDAKWAKPAPQRVIGDSFVTGGESLVLSRGYIELRFDNQTKITIEGPAAFQILSDDQIQLSYGRLYATVPQRAIGFTVSTLSAQVIDLGTEFGVEANSRGDTAIHVLKGKTVLIAGAESRKASMEVTEGIAKRVVTGKDTISDIPCDEGLFVRDIDSGSRLVWRGQKTLYLADLVSGGTGFESQCRRMKGLDLATGQLVNNANREQAGAAEGGRYVPVPDLPFVDGVFVPDCGNGPLTVSSRGDTYAGFGDTSGRYYLSVCSNNNVYVNYMGSLINCDLLLKGYDPKASSFICLHANAGVTFDLDAIRDRIPARILRFQTAYGISWSDAERTTIASDFYVLVDGQPRMVSRDVSEADGTQRISIPLQDGDRFLTLACTEGRQNDGDWSIFVNPILDLE